MNAANWSDEFLNRMRETGDPLADNAACFLWENKNSADIIKDLREISRDHNLSRNRFPTDVLDYFDQTENISVTPEDIEQFKISSRLFNLYGYRYCALLFFKALPTGYMCPKPGHVLEKTKLLVNFAARRVMETAQFVFAVNQEDWYKPGNPGLESIQRVRLMHAGMRMALMHDERPDHQWDMARGVPINQEDMALTNYLFSLSMNEGMDLMGIHLSQEERMAVFHTWQKIGQAMGLCDEILVSDYQDGLTQYKKIFHRQCSVDNPSGPILTQALLESMNELLQIKIPMHDLEDVATYFVNDSRSWKSLGMHKPTTMDRIMDVVFQQVTSMRIWQSLFRHQGSIVQYDWVTKIANFFITKRFDLSKHLAQYPNLNVLETLSKMLLVELSKRDLQTFGKDNPQEIKKSFLIPDKLYEAWDLGGFDLSAKTEAL
ncbi:MAG TPA: oxygenase MpaB family protein [Saprospiraceae bacterium]|nr:oxygenase MpaB family protein [Saprospiraceae bacterium]